MTGHALAAVAAGIPGLVAGWLLGDLAFGRMKQETFRWLVLAMLMATGTVALVEAIRG